MRCARPSLYNRKRETSAEAEKPLVFYAARSCSSPFASENPLQQNAASHIELASFISGGSMNPRVEKSNALSQHNVLQTTNRYQLRKTRKYGKLMSSVAGKRERKRKGILFAQLVVVSDDGGLEQLR
ncbi:hypothetical protein OUZ56_000851 [Daphnia magna]|uniref:Uncharacterized protein n=1 Tax=Daphnia magna TaxID=35525 RepID=A0ABR0A0Y1_9CRUS|nr:hypothetical protein OUZ56_000851 [Daphnia magna]